MIKWLLTRAVEDDNVASGYDLVYTPNVTREELFEISGHLPLYAANQYPRWRPAPARRRTCAIG